MLPNEVNRLFEKALDVDGVRVVTMYLKDTTPDTLRGMMDKLRDAAPDAVGALIATSGGKRPRWQSALASRR